MVATNNAGTIVFDVPLPTSFNFSEQSSNVRNGGAHEYGDSPFNSIALDTEFSFARGFFDDCHVNESDNGATQAIHACVLARRDLSQCEKTTSVFAFNYKTVSVNRRIGNRSSDARQISDDPIAPQIIRGVVEVFRPLGLFQKLFVRCLHLQRI